LFVDDNDTVDVYVHWPPDVLGCARGWFDLPAINPDASQRLEATARTAIATVAAGAIARRSIRVILGYWTIP
jgi:hypothetical protein